MMNEDYQRTLLMAQLNNKRTLKQKYLRQREEQASAPLTGVVMTNVMLQAIWKRVDIFGAIQGIRAEAELGSDAGFDTVMGWLQAMADALDCSPYELFVEDRAKQEKIIHKLLQNLDDCDSWENIRTDDRGNGSFALPGFDYAWRMTERPSATLLFEKNVKSEGVFTYTLTLGDGRKDLIPSQGVLWQETQGALQEFTDRLLEELESGWPILKEQFARNRIHMNKELETLQDLSLLLEAAPTGLNIAALLAKEAEVLSSILEKERILYDKMPRSIRESGRGKQVKNALLLLGGAIKSIGQMAAAAPDTEPLSEVLFLLENAAQPI